MTHSMFPCTSFHWGGFALCSPDTLKMKASLLNLFISIFQRPITWALIVISFSEIVSQIYRIKLWVVGWVYRYIPIKCPKHNTHFSSQNAILKCLHECTVSILDTSLQRVRALCASKVFFFFQQRGTVKRKKKRISTGQLAHKHLKQCSWNEPCVFLNVQTNTLAQGQANNLNHWGLGVLFFSTRLACVSVWPRVRGAQPGLPVSGGFFSSKQTWAVHNEEATGKRNGDTACTVLAFCK